MFYSHNILTKKGGSLGIVWIAANFQPGIHHISLTRREYCSVSIEKACEEVLSPSNPMALRLSANLLVGIVRIHRQQAHYTYIESKHVWQRIKHAYEKNRPTTDLPTGHTRIDAVTLPDPTSQVMLNTTFPGSDHSFTLDSLLTTDLFSMTAALPTRTPSRIHSTKTNDDSPYTADPRDISLEEEDNEVPLETMQIQIPGEGGDFGDSVLVECPEGPVMMVDNVPMPTLNTSDNSMSVGGEMVDCSSDNAGVSASSMVEDGLREGVEERMDSVLLFDEKTNSFQLYKENRDKVLDAEQGTPVLKSAMLNDVGIKQRQEGRRKQVRRKLAFDALIKTKSTTIKDNMNSAHTILRDKHTLCCPVPRRVKPAILLSHPACIETLKNPALLSLWQYHSVQPDFEDQPEFQLEHLRHDSTPSSTSILSDKEVARDENSTNSRLSSPGASTMEVARAGDEKSLDSHHTTGLTATFSDVSSLTSMRHHSNLAFETSSAQRQNGPSCALLPALDGLSPIADVDGETESSFNTGHGEYGLPDLDVSYGSNGAGVRTQAQTTPALLPLLDNYDGSPTTECEPLVYLSHVSCKMGGRLEIEFHELLSSNTSRRTASRAFAHILELVTAQILTATQDQPYSTIKIQRGERF